MTERALRFAPDSLDVLKRGTYLQVDTRGRATRCAMARAAFLDSLLRDEEVVSEIVEDFNGITGAPAIIDELKETFENTWLLLEEQGVMGSGGGAGSRRYEDLTPQERAEGRPLAQRQRELSTRLMSIITGKSKDQTRALILAASRWTHSKGIYWPWLVSNLVNWYRDKVLYQNPHGGWRGTLQRKPDEWKMSVADDLDLLPSLAIRRKRGESAENYRKRAREECASFVRSLQDEWPEGNMPTDSETIERKVGWLYENRLRGVSISALSKDFENRYQHRPPDERLASVDGRRKDIREGIRDAEGWLAESGPYFIGPPPMIVHAN